MTGEIQRSNWGFQEKTGGNPEMTPGQGKPNSKWKTSGNSKKAHQAEW